MIHVSDPIVKSSLIKQDVDFNNREAWIERVQEYDIEIKPIKPMKRNVLCKALVEDQPVEEEGIPKVLMVSLQDP